MSRLPLAAASIAAAALSVALTQVAPVSPGDWPMYNRDLAGTLHSPLTQITPANVSRLTRAWTFKMGPDPSAGSITGGSEYTPVVVNGVMYVATAKAVQALDAASGKQIWRYELDIGTPSKRGVTFWPGSGEMASRVFFTAGRRLIALEAEIGRRAEGFGKNGEIDMGQDLQLGPDAIPRHAPGGHHRFRAFDSRTGAELWVSPRLAMSAHAVPVTYLGRDGKQYVAVVAAGQSALDDKGPEGGEELVAYSLP